MVPACAALPVLFFLAQQDYVADGLKALDTNQPAVAEALFRKSVEALPGDFTAHFNLALALSIEHKDEEAIAQLRRTLELKPGLYEAEINLSTLLLRDNRATEAIPVLRDALTAMAGEKEKATRTNLLLAQALEATNNPSEAAEQYRKTLELDPNSGAAYAGLAHTELAQAKLADAEAHYRRAATIDASYRSGLLAVGAAYERGKDLPAAIAIYKEFPEDAGARDRLAKLLVDSGKSAEAIPALEAAVQNSPTVANRLALADAYKLDKQVDKAIRQLELAVTENPTDYERHMDLGRELRDQRRFVAAADQFAAAAKLRPDSVKAWNELAAVLIVNEDYANGLAALDHVRALGKEVPGDFFYRALSLERLKQPKPALEAYRQFLNADGGKLPDQEFQARQRIRIIESELNRK
jgi:tetratricopeptide (TPR) repeat protein